MSAEAQAQYKRMFPDRVRARDRMAKAAKAERERERLGWDHDFPRDQVTKRLYRIWGPDDVDRWFSEAKERDARIVLDKSILKRLSTMDLVPNEPFRRAFEKTTMKHEARKAICKHLAKMEKWDGQPRNAYGSRTFADKKALHEHLGIQLRKSRDGHVMRIFITYQLAEACCKALGMMPPECGI